MNGGIGRMAGAGGVFAGSLALCLAGMATLAQGVAVPVKAMTAQHRLEQVFEQRLATSLGAKTAPREVMSVISSGTVSPQKPLDTSILPTDGPIARLSVERLGVRDIVLAGKPTHEQLASGPTLLKRGNAASPVTILAAHRDTHFLFIRDLRPGDEVALQFVTGGIERYRITRFETVRWNRFAYPLDPAHPLLALATCFPFGGAEYGGPWRRVAWAVQVK